MFPNPTTRPELSSIASPTVMYLVIAVIFFRPSSPSFCISSSAGMAIVRSCMIMEAVIYGVTDNAKIDICSNDPPVKELKMFSESPRAFCMYSLIASALIPGTVIRLPSLITTRIKNVYKSLLRISCTLNALIKVLNILHHLCFSAKSFNFLSC